MDRTAAALLNGYTLVAIAVILGVLATGTFGLIIRTTFVLITGAFESLTLPDATP